MTDSSQSHCQWTDQALNTRNLEEAAKTIALASSNHKIVVEKSTAPCGTAKVLSQLVSIRELLRSAK
jgi:UDP-glucose 6-dehydrogenase